MMHGNYDDKRIDNATIERYQFGDYIVEVEEYENKWGSLMWDFWMTKKGYGIKSYIVGIQADQTQAKEPHIYTKEEALDLAMWNIYEHIVDFRNEFEFPED